MRVRDQVSGVGEICRSALRLSPGTSDYGACTDSLSDSLRQIGAAQGIERARQTCVDRGVRPGGSDLALCMVEEMRAPTPAAPALNASFAPSGKSYAYMSFKDRRHAEQLSCAALGLEPGSTGFGGCVASLDAALFNADNPAH